MAAVVLIVDDNEHLRAIFSQVLRSHGYETLEAVNGFDAITKTMSAKPNLIFMDFDLPDMNGADVARIIKNHPVTGSIPIIGCSAFLGSEFRDAAIKAGMVDYLIKPVSVERIRAKVEEFILLER
jgi:CheY-like chemotaxis protein